MIAILASLILMTSNGMSLSGLSVFDESLLREFGWNRGELKFRDMITLGVTGLAAPLMGILIDRYGVRACLLAGWLLLILAYWLYASIDSLADMYIVHVLLGLVLLLCGLNVGVILVSHWFVERRGTAIGIALVGTSLGGAIFPQYGTSMIGLLGWRGALLSELVFPVAMLLLTLLVVRSTPADRGTLPLGGSAAGGDHTEQGMAYGEAIRTRSFWALAVIACTTFYTVLWAAVVSFGLGWGGVYTVLQLSAINCFGLRSAGKILGTITVLDAIGRGLGIWLTGVLYTTQGSYMLPFVIFCLLIGVALLAIGQITYPSPETAN